jgi:hypothetical protein
MDIVSVMTKLNRKKVENAPGSRRRVDMKKIVKLNDILVRILAGRSHTMDEKASANG